MKVAIPPGKAELVSFPSKKALGMKYVQREMKLIFPQGHRELKKTVCCLSWLPALFCVNCI